MADRSLIYKAAAVATATLCLSAAAAQTNKTRPLNIDAAATIGAYAVDASTGKAVWAYNENLWLTPASLTKVLTTGAALQAKGADARLRTRIELTAEENGLCALRIIGEFDPTTNSSRFEQSKLEAIAKRLAGKLKKMGIASVDSVCVDDSRESADALNPKILWEDMGNYYGAPPSCVNYMDNSASLYFSTPNAVGKDCTLDSIAPKIEGLNVWADVTTHASNADGSTVRWLGRDSWHVTGSLPRGRKAMRVRSVMPHPALRYAEALAALLKEDGVEVKGVGSGTHRAGTEVMTAESPTIGEIVKETNHESINLFADALAMNMALGRKSKGRISWSDAADAVMSFWKGRYGLEMHLDDGSGLSPQGAVSAKTMVRAISAMRGSREWDAFRESLPIVGRSGTVSQLGQNLAVAGHARAKSGTMTGVVAYAGVVKTARGRDVTFCIIVNHHKEGVWAVRTEIGKWLNKIYND